MPSHVLGNRSTMLLNRKLLRRLLRLADADTLAPILFKGMLCGLSCERAVLRGTYRSIMSHCSGEVGFSHEPANTEDIVATSDNPAQASYRGEAADLSP